MLHYIVKRLLLMIPTLFAIVLIVFVLVNIAPGTPGQAQNVSGSEQADQAANARESYRLFKLQYHLDKPILINTRYLLSEARVIRALETAASALSQRLPAEDLALHVGRQAAAVLQYEREAPKRALEAQLAAANGDADAQARIARDIQNLGSLAVDVPRPPRAAPGDVIRAENHLEDWGHDIVPFLLHAAESYLAVVSEEGDHAVWFARDAEDDSIELRRGGTITREGTTWRLHHAQTAKVRFLATQRLSVNARRRVLVGDGERADAARLEANRAILHENNTIARWTFPLSATDEERAAVVAQWTAWYDAHRDLRYTRTVGSRIHQTFLDTRFAHYLGNLMPIRVSPTLQLRAPDLGTSMRYRRPVLDVIGEHWRYSVLLSVVSILLAYVIAIPIGVVAAVRHNGPIADRGIGVLLFVLYSLPVFFGATLLQTWLTPARGLDWFPVSGFDDGLALERTALAHMWVVTKHLILPIVCLTYPSLAALSRYARSGLLDVIRADYVRTARAKGLPGWMVVSRHAVRNGIIPIITLLGSTLPAVIGGSIVIEYIFAIEGMGALMLQSIGQRDYNVIMGVLLLSSVLTLIGILLSDIAYALVDPRISYE